MHWSYLDKYSVLHLSYYLQKFLQSLVVCVYYLEVIIVFGLINRIQNSTLGVTGLLYTYLNTDSAVNCWGSSPKSDNKFSKLSRSVTQAINSPLIQTVQISK